MGGEGGEDEDMDILGGGNDDDGEDEGMRL